MRPETPRALIRPLTQHLAEMQTAILAQGLRAFGGDVMRFLLLAVIARETLDQPGDRTLSMNSLAQSIGEPFETVRRHVNALVAQGVCIRRPDGVAIAPIAPDHFVMPIMLVAHDALVRFIERCRTAGELTLPAGSGSRAALTTGVQVAVDVMLAAIANNRLTHGSVIDLALFSTVLEGNLQRARTSAGWSGGRSEIFLDGSVAVPLTSVASTLSVPYTTVRRRLTALTTPGGPLRRTSRGIVVSAEWLATEMARQATERSYAEVGRILRRGALAGFPFDDPTSAYIVGPPSLMIAP